MTRHRAEAAGRLIPITMLPPRREFGRGIDLRPRIAIFPFREPASGGIRRAIGSVITVAAPSPQRAVRGPRVHAGRPLRARSRRGDGGAREGGGR